MTYKILFGICPFRFIDFKDKSLCEWILDLGILTIIKWGHKLR